MKYSIIIPIYNEENNIQQTIQKISTVLNKSKIIYEVIFVDDDSKDNSLKVFNRYRTKKTKFLVRKDKPRDLSKSVVYGFNRAKYDNFIVMDGDLQHSSIDLIKLLSCFKTNSHDIVMGSRNMVNHKKVNLNPLRFHISNLLNTITNFLFDLKLKDPMSGFFIIKKKIYLKSKKKLFLIGYKILLDIIVSHSTKLKIKEVYIDFKSRDKGFSKMRLKIFLQLIYFLIIKYLKLKLASKVKVNL